MDDRSAPDRPDASRAARDALRRNVTFLETTAGDPGASRAERLRALELLAQLAAHGGGASKHASKHAAKHASKHAAKHASKHAAKQPGKHAAKKAARRAVTGGGPARRVTDGGAPRRLADPGETKALPPGR